MEFPDTLDVDWVTLDQVFPSPSNPRRNDDAVGHVAASLRRFGWRQPIVARPDGEVIAGNTRLKAAVSLDMERVPVVWFKGSEIDATAFAIADNRTHEFAEWDESALAKLLEDLKAEDALDGVGFDEDDLDALLEELAEGGSELDDDGAEEPPEKPVTQPGDCWVMGEHRLLCGDSTSQRDVATLFGGLRPDLMVTDPPYGVSYQPTWRQDAGLAEGGKTAEVANDDRVDWTAAWSLFPGDVAYVWHAGVHAAHVAEQLGASGFEVRSQIIWSKPTFAISRGHYHWQHEPCWYVVREGKTASWKGDRSQTTLWEMAHEKDDVTEHSTQKPLEAMLRPIRNHSAPIVYDPFCGSGTTLIAAEQAGRRCLAMELTPAFCDVIVRRWERATGGKAQLEGSGETFDETADRRSD